MLSKIKSAHFEAGNCLCGTKFGQWFATKHLTVQKTVSAHLNSADYIAKQCLKHLAGPLVASQDVYKQDLSICTKDAKKLR